MAPLITPVNERVLERFIYEGALVHNRIKGRRRPIRLRDVVAASVHNPRLREVVPAVLRLRPQMIADSRTAMYAYPDLRQLLKTWDTRDAPAQWEGIPFEDLRRHERRLHQLWHHQRTQTKWRTMNLRLSDRDLERLIQLSNKYQMTNKSSLIRHLIAEAVKS